MVVVDGCGVPIGAYLDSASPSEMKLLEPTIDKIAVPRTGRGRPRKKPKRIVADRGYDSDPLRKRLAERGIELICRFGVIRKKNFRMPKLRRYR
jgi:hypothetical protein